MTNESTASTMQNESAYQTGMSLIEALVALLVLSIGMLGIAALYVETTRANRTATIRTQVVGLVEDMADRIRANPSARGAYDMVGRYGGAPATRNCVGRTAAADNCTSDELAEDDLWWWRAATQWVLPGSVPNVVYTAGPGTGTPDRYQISITWNEASNRTDAAQERYSYQSNIEFISVTP